MESIIVGIFLISILTAYAVLMISISNGSRCTLEQAARLSGCPESELWELIQEGYLTYRRKYILFGPRSLDVSTIASARAGAATVKRAQAEADAAIRQAAEKAAADLNSRVNEANRLFQEQEQLRREEAEMMRRILNELRKSLQLIPSEVRAALQTLGLPPDASFDEVRQRYRLLAKRSHPDAGGEQHHFIQITEAYHCVIAWIKSQG